MAEIIIDGKAVAAAVNAENARKCEELAKKYGSRPGLAVVLVGDDPASQVYVSSKVRKCGELGIYSEKIVLPKDSTQQQVLDVIDTLNKNPEIHGILVQSPPPPQISEEEIILAIDPKKDVDCFHPYNTGRMLQGDLTGSLPCTPAGVMELLKYYKIPTSGKRAAVLGRSNIVGKPMMCLLSGKGADATVTLCHSRTRDLAEELRRADIIVAAIGKPEFVKGDIDGRSRVKKHKLQRDGKGFETIEQYQNIGGALKGCKRDTKPVVLVECMSNLLANECFEENGHPDNIFAECMQLYSECSHLVIVTNEVFSDGCEYDDSTTDYIRRLGELNVKLAKAADTVVEVVYTIPVVLKGDISYVGN